MKMKALVIAPQPFFTPRGTPFSVYYRTLIKASLGVSVDLLTYGEGDDVDIPGVRIIRIPRFSFFGKVKIGPSYLKLFLDLFILIWTVGLLVRNRYDFVHAHEEAVFICRYLKPIFKFKMVYDMHSSLPQQLTNFQFTSSKFLINLFRRLEDSCLHGADAVITICPDLYDYTNEIIVDKEKHLLIENSIFDKVRLLPKPSNPVSSASEVTLSENSVSLPEGKQLVVYAGTLEPYQGIDILIGGFSEVVAECPDAFLIIVGGSESQVERYKNMAKECGITGYSLFTGLLPQSAAKYYSSMASVLVSPRCEGTNTPLKIYEYLCSGIPIVATDIYSHTQVLNSDVAFLVKPEPDSMAAGIISALKSDHESRKVASNAKELYEDKYSRRVYESKMKKLLEILS